MAEMPPVVIAPFDRPLAIAPAAALTAVERVAARWSLRRQDLPVLLGRKPRTVRSWYERTPAHLDHDVLERIGHLIGIYDILHTVFGDGAYADRWVHEPNLAFGDKKPSELILTGSFTNLVYVHRYLQQVLV